MAAGLAVLTSLVHLIWGGMDALNPMLAAELPQVCSAAMHACWHVVSVFLILSAVVFWYGKDAAFYFGMLWIASAIIFLYVGYYQAGFAGWITNPQWTILLPTGCLALFATRRRESRAFATH